MARMAIKIAETDLSDLDQLLRDESRNAPTLHIDETPYEVLKDQNQKSYFWAFATPQEFSGHQVVLFHYSGTRSGRTLQAVLPKNYSGLVMCDGFTGYQPSNLPQAQFGACLVHVVREFKDIIKAKLHYGGGEARKVVKTAVRKKS